MVLKSSKIDINKIKTAQTSPGLVNGLANLGNAADVDAAVEAAHPDAVITVDIVLTRRPTFGDRTDTLGGIFSVDERAVGRLSCES